jgi:hypothetical protein
VDKGITASNNLSIHIEQRQKRAYNIYVDILEFLDPLGHGDFVIITLTNYFVAKFYTFNCPFICSKCICLFDGRCKQATMVYKQMTLLRNQTE